MRLIEITFTYDEGWQQKCERNGVMKTSRKTINVDEIVSVSEWEGQLLHQGRVGTKVLTSDGKSHVDDRTYDQFLALLNEFKQ